MSLLSTDQFFPTTFVSGVSTSFFTGDYANGSFLQRCFASNKSNSFSRREGQIRRSTTWLSV